MPDIPQHHMRSVPVDGGSVRVRVDDSDLKPMFLIHGGPGVTDYLSKAFGPPLRDAGYRPVGIIQRGCPGSPSDGPFTVQANSDDIEAVRRELDEVLGGFEKIGLLAHSWGGFLAAYYASQHLERVERLMLICPMGPRGGWQEERDAALWERLGPEGQEKLRHLDAHLEGLSHPSEDEVNSHYAQRYALLNQGYFAPSNAAGKPGLAAFSWPVHRDTTASVEKLYGETGWFLDLKQLDRPVYQIGGAEDAMPASIGDMWMEVLPSHAKHVRIPECGHFPWMEKADAFQSVLSEFLREK
ncbi:MAG: alpha/beta hydrolase [Sumerlaeia bacterium]